MQPSHQKPSMTADPLRLDTTEQRCAEALARVTTHINRSAGQHMRAIRANQQAARVGESDALQGMPISMLCCGDGSCGDRGCEGHPDNQGAVPVDNRMRRMAMIGLIAWCLFGVLAGIAAIGYVFGLLFPGL